MRSLLVLDLLRSPQFSKLSHPSIFILKRTVMKAIQTTGKIDAEGQLSLDSPIKGTLSRSVRVIIFLEETESDVNDFLGQISQYQQNPLISAEKLQQGLKQLLTDAGYDSREKIINLVQDIKREISQERQQKQK